MYRQNSSQSLLNSHCPQVSSCNYHFFHNWQVVHGGFLARSQEIPAEALFLLANHRRQDLVFCGHSLGAMAVPDNVVKFLHKPGRPS